MLRWKWISDAFPSLGVLWLEHRGEDQSQVLFACIKQPPETGVILRGHGQKLGPPAALIWMNPRAHSRTQTPANGAPIQSPSPTRRWVVGTTSQLLN